METKQTTAQRLLSYIDRHGFTRSQLRKLERVRSRMSFGYDVAQGQLGTTVILSFRDGSGVGYCEDYSAATLSEFREEREDETTAEYLVSLGYAETDLTWLGYIAEVAAQIIVAKGKTIYKMSDKSCVVQLDNSLYAMSAQEARSA